MMEVVPDSNRAEERDRGQILSRGNMGTHHMQQLPEGVVRVNVAPNTVVC